MTVPAIAIEHLYKRYAELQALEDVHFDIPEGSFFGLLGPNGAGKSTLINTMAGLVFATEGTIRVMGHDVRQQWRQARHALGVVPQELVYDSFFTVQEILRLQSGYFGLGRANHAWVEELLVALSLTDKTHTAMKDLSGGMKRRVLIAQALVHKPSVVVLDEPTAGVDVELRKVLWEFTNYLHKQGHTIVLTTHYLEEAENLCDSIAILNHGQLIALDDKTALLGRYPYRLLSLSLPLPTADSIHLPDSLKGKVKSFADGELVFCLHREHDPIGGVLETLRTAGIQFIDLRTKEPSLEDVFVNLTHQQESMV